MGILRTTRRLLLGRPLRSEARYDPFFVVGSGRCGTTLVRAILSAHPAVGIPPEMPRLGKVIRRWRRYSRLSWRAVLKLCLADVEYDPSFSPLGEGLGDLYGSLRRLPPPERNLARVLDALYRELVSRSQPGATRWGDKTPENVFRLAAIRRVFPDARILHVLRDGRDVARSLRDLDDRWSLERAARRWRDAVRAACRHADRHPDLCLEVRYEELCREPEPVVERIATFLDLDLRPAMLRPEEGVEERLADVADRPHHARLDDPIGPDRIGCWREELTDDEVAEVERVAGPDLARAGYA